MGFLLSACLPHSICAGYCHGKPSCGGKAWPRAQSHKQWVTNLCPGPVCSSTGSYRLCCSQTRELLEEISPQALNYQPWPSDQGCFPSCTVSGSSASIAAVPVPVPRTPGTPPGMLEAGENRLPLHLAVPLCGGSCFQRVGVTRTGLSHPSHPALIGYPASEAKELQRLMMSLLCNRKNSPGQG